MRETDCCLRGSPTTHYLRPPPPPPLNPPDFASRYIYTAGMTIAAASIFGVIALFTQFMLSRVERELQTTVKASLVGDGRVDA